MSKRSIAALALLALAACQPIPSDEWNAILTTASGNEYQLASVPTLSACQRIIADMPDTDARCERVGASLIGYGCDGYNVPIVRDTESDFPHCKRIERH